jgi:coenzyme F420-reducing hydrogenase delta subunit
VLACRNSGEPALRQAEAAGLLDAQEAGYHVVALPCGGAVHELSVLGTLLAGGEQVALLTCHPGSCVHLEGEHRCALRVRRIHETLAELGLPADTVVQIPISPAEPARLARRLREVRGVRENREKSPEHRERSPESRESPDGEATTERTAADPAHRGGAS